MNDILKALLMLTGIILLMHSPELLRGEIRLKLLERVVLVLLLIAIAKYFYDQSKAPNP